MNGLDYYIDADIGTQRGELHPLHFQPQWQRSHVQAFWVHVQSLMSLPMGKSCLPYLENALNLIWGNLHVFDVADQVGCEYDKTTLNKGVFISARLDGLRYNKLPPCSHSKVLPMVEKV